MSKSNYIIFHNTKIFYGIGGIHSCIKPGIYQTTDTQEILDIDIAGYYMNIVAQWGREYGIYPQHLGISFVDVVDQIIAERAKYPKGSGINNGLKLAGNGGIFGASKDKFTCIYDLRYFLRIVVAGQLIILKLVENICSRIPNLKLIQINTDGITVLIDKDKKGMFIDICNNWEHWSKMKLEYVTYKNMYVQNVNNYIAVSDKGKVKYKGAYEIIKELHKNDSMRIVRIAVSNYFLENKPIEDTIRNHTNIYDFCKRFKATKGWNSEYHHIINGTKVITPSSKNIRYFVSLGNGGLYKKKVSQLELKHDCLNTIYKEGFLFVDDEEPVTKTQFIGIEAGKSVTLFNKYYELPIKDYRIDYLYYIREANKLVSDIENKQSELF